MISKPWHQTPRATMRGNATSAVAASSLLANLVNLPFGTEGIQADPGRWRP